MSAAKRDTKSKDEKYLGYLNSGSKASIILKECLICPKMTDCMLDKTRSIEN